MWWIEVILFLSNVNLVKTKSFKRVAYLCYYFWHHWLSIPTISHLQSLMSTSVVILWSYLLSSSCEIKIVNFTSDLNPLLFRNIHAVYSFSPVNAPFPLNSRNRSWCSSPNDPGMVPFSWLPPSPKISKFWHLFKLLGIAPEIFVPPIARVVKLLQVFTGTFGRGPENALYESLRNWSCGNVYKSSDDSSPSREL